MAVRRTVLIIAMLSAAMELASATILKDEKNINWASRRDLTSAEFSAAFTRYSQQGLMMIDVDAYPAGGGLRYSMVWRANTDKRGWAERRNLTSSQYSDWWNRYRQQKYRPLAIAAYPSGNQVLWAGIWVENRENIRWASYRNLTSARYGEIFNQLKSAYRLVDMEAYQTPEGLRYSAIWYQNTDSRLWAQRRNMTRSQYQAEVSARSVQGYVVVDYESYETSAGRQYAAIWEKKPGYAWQVRTGRTATQFANLWRQYRDEGYRLVDFERYRISNGNRYGGIWVENNWRFRYSRKDDLNMAMANYRTTNDLPGVSIAIIRNGATLYRRGFGFADVDDGKVAHSGTVYNSASVSKAVGGTLAAKLEDERVLRNGLHFSLDLTNNTSNYVANLPSQHTHTVEQTLSHLGCIAHYTTTPSISNQTVHYANATAAVASISSTSLVSGCTIGSTRSYSTPAFTFAAAALEQATGHTINELLQDELFEPFGLGSMRVQFSSSTLPTNYERATPYDGSNNETTYRDNSWKVIGGGIETSAYDLARFGWKVLNAEIVTANVRDNRLWQRVNPSFTTGLGWEIRTVGGRRVAEKDGSWRGARAFVRVYRDDGLVIAVMANKNAGNIGALTSRLANIVLN